MTTATGDQRPQPQTITTMAEALSLVPEYWPLVPCVDKWQEGDTEYIDSEEGYLTIDWNCHGDLVDHDGGRRPIPQSVREAEARWILYYRERVLFHESPNQDIFSTRTQDNGVLVVTEKMFGVYPKTIEALGGKPWVLQMLTEGPGALWRWVAEMRGNQ